MNEIWKAVEGTNGRYEVSNTGKVRSMNYGGHNGVVREMRPTKDYKGYMRVRITRAGKSTTVKVHREIAKAFIPNPQNKPEVNHINGDKTDNRVENLEWVTASENTSHAYNSGLKEETRERCRQMGATVGRKALAIDRENRKTPVTAVRLSDGATFEYSSQAEAAAETKTPQGNIHKVLNGKRKSANGYRFVYKERG